MTTTIDILDTVLLNFRITDGKFLADLGTDVVEVDYLHRDGDGNVWASYWHEGEYITTRKHEAQKLLTRRVW